MAKKDLHPVAKKHGYSSNQASQSLTRQRCTKDEYVNADKVEGKRTCTKCKVVYDRTSEFFKNQSSGRNGLSRHCKSCINKAKQIWVAKRIEHKCPQCKVVYKRNEENFHRSGIGVGFASTCKICCNNRLPQKAALKRGNCICRVCKVELPLNKDNYSIRTVNVTGFQYTCKKCKSTITRKNEAKRKGRNELEYVLQHRVNGAKHRAAKRKIPFLIDYDYISNMWHQQNGKCAISKIEMSYTTNAGKTLTNVSIDRISSDEGYIKGNVQLVCNFVNQMKSDLTVKEFIGFCKTIAKENDYER